MCLNLLACFFSSGALCVQLLWAASGTSGVTGGRSLPQQFARQPLQWKPLWQHRLMLRPRTLNCHWTSKLKKWPQRTSDAPLNCKDLNCRLFLCASSSMSAPQSRRLQALAAAFAAVCALSLLEEKCTADYSTCTLLSHKAAKDSAKFFRGLGRLV